LTRLKLANLEFNIELRQDKLHEYFSNFYKIPIGRRAR